MNLKILSFILILVLLISGCSQQQEKQEPVQGEESKIDFLSPEDLEQNISSSDLEEVSSDLESIFDF